MLQRDRIQEIVSKVMSVSTADETEVRVGIHRNALTRFAENRIHQNVSVDNSYLSVTAIIGKQMGTASSNQLDEHSIKRTVETAIQIAKASPPDEELLPRLGPQEYREVRSYDQEIDRIDPAVRASLIADVVSLSARNGLRSAGALSHDSGCEAYATSNGLFAFYESTEIRFSVTAIAQDSSGWAERSSHFRSMVEPIELGGIAVEKALKSKDPIDLEPGEYTVILEPDAVSELVEFLLWGFNALSVDEGRSFLTGKVGQKLFGENISLFSDPYHPLHQGRPFDGDGVPMKRVELVKDGVVNALVYDRLTASKHNVEPTGHGMGGRNTYGAYPYYPVLNGGKNTIDEMIDSTERGILVTRFWYTNIIDPMNVIVTGMTRDGTFLIQNGKVSRGIKNFRFNQNVIEMLNNVEMMSEPTLAGGIVVPAMKVSKFNFTSKTSAI